MQEVFKKIIIVLIIGAIAGCAANFSYTKTTKFEYKGRVKQLDTTIINK